MNDRQQRLEQEKAYWRQQRTHWLTPLFRRQLFCHPERSPLAYRLIQERFQEILRTLPLQNRMILNAPCGDGSDFGMIEAVSRKIVGVDLSPEALREARGREVTWSFKSRALGIP